MQRIAGPVVLDQHRSEREVDGGSGGGVAGLESTRLRKTPALKSRDKIIFQMALTPPIWKSFEAPAMLVLSGSVTLTGGKGRCRVLETGLKSALCRESQSCGRCYGVQAKPRFLADA